MRDIRFRAKSEKTGQWVFGYLLNENSIGKVGEGCENCRDKKRRMVYLRKS